MNPGNGVEITAEPAIQFTASQPAECRVVPVVPQPDPRSEYNPPAESEFDHAYGAENPAITILSYCNYQRSACRTLVQNLADLQQKYPEKVRVILRQYPQPETDDKSLLAAYSAEAAGESNRFWQVNDLLYQRQAEWSGLTPDEFLPWLAEELVPLGVAKEQFEANLNNPAVQERVVNVMRDAEPLMISATPLLFFNNIVVKTRVNIESLDSLVRYFLLEENARDACPELTIDAKKSYTTTLKTEKGDIVIDLYADKAPIAVNSFIHLAQSGWYDNTPFYKVIPGFITGGGDPSGTGLGGPGYGFTDEVDPALRFDKPGVVALDHLPNGLNGSVFFITYAPLPDLDGSFTIFGQVVEGMDVLNYLRPRNPESDELILPAETLISVTIKEEE
jgi:cyclophilin family peptidyl-prolyl cis-trans isomerase/protein-disulfide isomerase